MLGQRGDCELPALSGGSFAAVAERARIPSAFAIAAGGEIAGLAVGRRIGRTKARSATKRGKKRPINVAGWSPDSYTGNSGADARPQFHLAASRPASEGGRELALLKALLIPLQAFNDAVLKIGRAIAIVAIGLMVVAILIQVFFRYALNNPLPWPDEAARFAMLWMTGLIAPLAYRRGGFVAIDTLARALPQRLAALLALILLGVAFFVLAVAVDIGWGEVTGFMSRAKTASLYYVNLSLEWAKVPRQWMMLSFYTCVILLLIVNIELILRAVITILGGGAGLAETAPHEEGVMAE